jgi:putative hydrolase of the HAD superfamily
MNIRAVIFDRDNTLLYFDPAAVMAIEARIAEVAPALPPNAVNLHWSAWPGPWPRTPADEPAFWCGFWGDLANRYQLDSDTTTALYELGAFYHSCFSAFPDALACLGELRSHGMRLAVLTNFELPSIALTLQHAGIDPSWFTALLSSTAIGCHKPDSRAYFAAVAELGLPLEQCAFVDDRIENVEAARALGMPAWLLDRREEALSSMVPCVRDLQELTRLLTSL